ncbi:hypothetical protein [Leeuwenhoekiella sp. NPDC079379]|uniref:hypothetical protein n=1 Tax=Leeuwenhoekiella sp. NPDC079379 TaxID=3364122 RepID=UPI0037CA8083
MNAELYDSKNDELTTLVKSLNGKPMLIHTWFARSYGWNKYQTKRIDSLLQIFNSKIVPEESESVSIIKDPYFKYQNKIKKFFLKLKMKSFIK